MQTKCKYIDQCTQIDTTQRPHALSTPTPDLASRFHLFVGVQSKDQCDEGGDGVSVVSEGKGICCALPTASSGQC